MNRLTAISRTFGLAVLGFALTLAPSFAEDQDEEKHVVIKKVVRCDDEADCEESENSYEMKFSGPDAKVWHSTMGHHGEGKMVMMSHGGSGGFLGVTLADLTPELRTHFGVGDAGVMVSKVLEESPAARAGILVGDILTALDGKALRSSRELAHQVHSKEDGETVLIELWRDGGIQNLTTTLEKREMSHTGSGNAFMLHCDDDSEDCSFVTKKLHKGMMAGGCGDAENCKVLINCSSEDDCTCTVNGEETACEGVHGFDH